MYEQIDFGDVMRERVVLINDDGSPIGAADKSSVHTTATPLHLAVSCYLFNDSGELLLTRRALSKKTWAGVWSNSFCGHPAPGESPADAVARRAAEELGCRLRDLRLVLPNFRYRAVDASGIVENEICPVYAAVIDGPLSPSSAEVAEWVWADPQSVTSAVALTPFAFSPWLVEQVAQLDLPQLARAHPGTQ